MADVELAPGMELTLNVGWAIVAVWMLCARMPMRPLSNVGRRAQFVALAVVILILLPAISMTDDLIAAQNPAEVDSSVRRDHDFSSQHSVAPTAAAAPAPGLARLPVAIVRMAAPNDLADPSLEHPALASIQNRPPPAA